VVAAEDGQLNTLPQAQKTLVTTQGLSLS